LIRRAVATLSVAVCALCAAPVHAQTVDFLTRGSFHLGAEHLSSDDERFVWDTNFGGDLDLVDYGTGRLTFIANYQAILGEQLRNFDPNQGNYILAGTLSRRFAALEIAGVFHHESRHLSDRSKTEAVDWNMLGARVLKSVAASGVRLDTRADLRWVILKSFVDYKSEFEGDVRLVAPIDARVSVIGDGTLRLLGVNDTRGRGAQAGFRIEGGVRVEGKGAAVELFVAGERRIDPYPLEFGTVQWLSAGFRLLSR
jgi:hypothetical protein